MISTSLTDVDSMHAAMSNFRSWPHRLALLTTCAVFPLIFVGAGVTSKEVGMVYPDGWTSNGHFWNPPEWTKSEGTLWEHGHRLLGRAVGLMAIALAVVSWRSGGAVRKMAILSLMAIIAQGVLGILRVEKSSTAFAMVHGVGAQICICILAVTALVTSRRWVERNERVSVRGGDFLGKLAGIVFAAVFLQLLTGAATRHFPSHLTVGSHVFLAIAVTFLLGWLCMWVCGTFRAATLLGALGRIIALAMVIQLFLGGASFLVVTMGASRDPLVLWLTPTVHTVVGATLLVGCLLLFLTCRRMVEPAVDESLAVSGMMPAS